MMKKDLYNKSYVKEKEEQRDYRELFFKYSIYWPLFVGGILLCLAIGWSYLYYTKPIYNISASVLIKDNDKSNKAGSSMRNLEDLGFFSSTSNFDNEIEILQSRTLTRKVIEELDLYINYISKDQFPNRELYKTSPVKVWLTPEEAEKLPNGVIRLELFINPGNKLSVKTTINEQEYKRYFEKFPALLTTSAGTFYFTLIDTLQVEKQMKIEAIVSVPRIVATAYNTALTIEPSSKITTIAQLSLQNTNRERGTDFIRKLVEIYNRDANDSKNEVATKTAEFIDERIKIINSELGTTEQELETFKRDAGLTDLKNDAQLALSENSEYEKKRAENSTQLRLIQFLTEYAVNPDHAYEVLPVNIGLTDRGLNDLINRYNEMLLERKRLLRTSSESNPAIANLDGSIRAMRNNVQTTIISVQKGLLITQTDLQRQAGKYAGRITNAPKQERQLGSISRQQEIKARLYLMLLQKREENAITLASTANNARIVDEALAALKPISPKSSIIYLVALIMGITLPVATIYIINFFRYKIDSRTDVEMITKIPIIGDIPLNDEKQRRGSIVVFENQNNMMTEAFRYLRTNMQYMLEDGKKVIMITSTTSGEGKSFIATNLAISFALLGKKVVVVGLDIRKPGLNKAFQLPQHKMGISQFLADPKSIHLMDLVQSFTANPNLSILPSGPVPPNPTELVAHKSLVQAIDILKKNFDYVILDTAPIGMVTDTKLIAQVSDASIYVCRANFTPKNGFSYINELLRENKLPNPCIVINGIDMLKKQNSYRYGYGKYGKYGKFYRVTYKYGN